MQTEEVRLFTAQKSARSEATGTLVNSYTSSGVSSIVLGYREIDVTLDLITKDADINGYSIIAMSTGV